MILSVILGVCLMISLIYIIVISTIKSRPILAIIEENTKLKEKVESLKSDLDKSENRRKNLLSINKGDTAMITKDLTFSKGNKDEKNFKVYCEVEILEVTDRSAKVLPINVITNDNSINASPSDLSMILEFLKHKWEPINEMQPILDTQSRREDKLEELSI